MNDRQRWLIQYICDGDIKKAQQQARIILNESTPAKDEAFRKNMLRKLDSKISLIELPYNLQELLIAEDVSNFPESRFVLRPEEAKAVEMVLSTVKASERLSELGISYLPALILYGESGGGKTMLARYIAHKADRPFIYVRFSSVVSSYLGSTQSNIAKVFEYARTAPCVLCFDEIDAVGMARGQKNDVGEMNRIVIALMQEMDRLPNNVILIGTTNRYDRLDPALIRRFTIRHEIKKLAGDDIKALAKKFFQFAGIAAGEWLNDWCIANFTDNEPASVVIEKCTGLIVEKVMREADSNNCA
jgi:SpoVK/Ycf46/Vps4 family AAA+-type ATPase